MEGLRAQNFQWSNASKKMHNNHIDRVENYLTEILGKILEKLCDSCTHMTDFTVH